METIYSIYKATNRINGKSYIGFTKNFENRKYTHTWAVFKGFRNLFHQALYKYGFDNFDWEIIYQSKDGEHCVNVMEPFFIDWFQTYYKDHPDKGYNMTRGGNQSPSPSKMRKSHIGKYPNEETRKKMSISQKKRNASGAKHPMLGYHHNKEAKKKIGAGAARIFEFVDPTGKNQTINNLAEFCRNNHLNVSKMSRVNSGHVKQHRGWTKKFAV